MGRNPLEKTDLREPLFSLLELERNALRWYTCGGTRIYFDRLAEACVEKAAPADVPKGKGRKRKGGTATLAAYLNRPLSVHRTVSVEDVASWKGLLWGSLRVTIQRYACQYIHASGHTRKTCA
jgi:hypothetical protein